MRYKLFEDAELNIISRPTNDVRCMPDNPDSLWIAVCKTGKICLNNEPRVASGEVMLISEPVEICLENYTGLFAELNYQDFDKKAYLYYGDDTIQMKNLIDYSEHNGGHAVIHCNTDIEMILVSLFSISGLYTEPLLRLKLLELLLIIQKITTEFVSCDNSAHNIELVKEIHKYLVDNIGIKITVEELSAKYHINKTTLNNLFRMVYGNSIAAHVKEHKMEYAMNLLKETDMSIAEIGKNVGYDSQSRFTEAFKEYYGILPRMLRKSY